MNKKLQVFKYLLADLASACSAWTFFYVFRKQYIETEKYGKEVPLEFDTQFWTGLLFVSLFWILIYYLTGTYRNIYRKSRLKETGQIFLISVIGVLILFFALLLGAIPPILWGVQLLAYQNLILRLDFLWP